MFVYGHPTDPIFQPPTLTFFISKIPEPGTTISGFADNKKKKNYSRPTDPRYFLQVTVNTHIFLFGLRFYIFLYIHTWL